MTSIWLASLWSASVRGGAVLLVVWILCCIPRVPAVVRSWIWRAAYSVLLISFIWSTPLNLPLLRAVVAPQKPQHIDTSPISLSALPDAESVRSIEDAVITPKAVVSPAPPARTAWPLIAFWLWLAFLLVYAGYLTMAWRKALLLRGGQSVDLPELVDLCRRMNIHHPPAVRTHSAVRGPLLVGVRHPVIVLPEMMVDAPHLKLILAHELAHLRRMDLLWNWLPTLAVAILPLHPLVWICNRQWRLATEAACDAETLAITGARPAEYGRVLVNVATASPRRTSGVLAVAVASESRWLLKKRLAMMNHIPQWNRRRLATAGMIVGVFAVLAAVPWRVVAQQAAPGAPVALAPSTMPTTKTTKTLVPTNLQMLGTIVVTDDTLRVATSGTVAKINAIVGQAVKRGDVLIQLDDTTAEADLAGEKAKLSFAEQDLQRKQRGREKGAASQTEVDLAQAQLQIARSAVTKVTAELDATQVRAPFDGIVTRCDVQLGDVVDSHQAVVTVLQDGPPQVRFDLPQYYVGMVRPGTSVSVEVARGSNVFVQGEVKTVSPMLNSETQTQQIIARLATTRPGLLPGMTETIRITLSP